MIDQNDGRNLKKSNDGHINGDGGNGKGIDADQ